MNTTALGRIIQVSTDQTKLDCYTTEGKAYTSRRFMTRERFLKNTNSLVKEKADGTCSAQPA